jgi:hypothetical protein
VDEHLFAESSSTEPCPLARSLRDLANGIPGSLGLLNEERRPGGSAENSQPRHRKPTSSDIHLNVPHGPPTSSLTWLCPEDFVDFVSDCPSKRRLKECHPRNATCHARSAEASGCCGEASSVRRKMRSVLRSASNINFTGDAFASRTVGKLTDVSMNPPPGSSSPIPSN